MEKLNKIVLAYSGGLDTSIIIPWLKENYDCEVIAVCADVGQDEDLDFVREKALKTGASKAFVEDLKKPFVEEYLWPMLKSGAVYEGKYLLGTSIARPLIAQALVNVALREGADAIAHGATGKGNDQVRFELTAKALAPHLKIVAPWREWDIRSREDAIDYAQKRNIHVPVTKARPYSMDRNLWHLSHEGGELENPAKESPDDVLMVSQDPQKASDKPEYVEIGFEKGIPISLDGKKLDGVSLIRKLNEIGSKHGIGIVDLVENRLVGMKSRGVYETPGGTILYFAQQELERLTLDRATSHYKQTLSLKYAEIVYDGQWFSPLREALDAFFNETQQTVTGSVRIKLYKGNVKIAGMQSPYSLYQEALATFGRDEVYKQSDAEGFINLFGLPLKVRALMMQNAKKKHL